MAGEWRAGLKTLEGSQSAEGGTDPFRDPMPGHKYDLSFVAPFYSSQLLTGNPFSAIAQKAAGIETPETPLHTVTNRLVDFNVGVLGHVAYWADRPYTAVMSAADMLTQGRFRDIPAEAWKGFKGGREAGFVNVLENFGLNPEHTGTQLAGVGLDIVAGIWLDPVNYVSFGSKQALRGVSQGSKLFGNADSALRFGQRFPATFDQLWKGGIDVMPARVELARNRLWGLNVSTPYFGKDSVVVSPTFVNELAAKGLDRLGNALEPVNTFIHKLWGGHRWWLEKTGLGDFADWVGMANAKQLQDTVRFRQRLNDALSEIPIEKRRQMTHVAENPDLVNVQGTVSTHTVRALTPEEKAAINAERMGLTIADAKAREEFNRVVMAEVAGLRNAVDDWVEEGRRMRIIRYDEIEDYLFDVSDPNYHVGDALEQLVSDLQGDPRRVNSAITQMLRDHHGYPLDGEDVIFKAVVPEAAYFRMASQQVMEQGSRAPKWMPKRLHDAWRKGTMTHEELIQQAATEKKITNRATLDKWREELVKMGRPKPGGALRSPTESELMDRVKREMGEFMPERASDLGETGNPRFLVQVPAHQTISDEFTNLGGPAGLASMNVRKGRVNKVLDALETNATKGGDNLEIVENYARMIDEDLPKAERSLARKRYLKEVNRMNKRAESKIDPNSSTFQQIIEAIHARRLANDYISGYYTRNAQRYAEDLIAGEIFGDDPAARYAATQRALRGQLDEVRQKLKAADEGRIPAAEVAPPDYMSPEDFKRLRTQMSKRDELIAKRNLIDEQLRNFDEIEAEDAALRGELYDPAQYVQARNEMIQERVAISNMLDSFDTDPIREAQARYKQSLRAEQEEILKQLENPDPFAAAVWTRNELRKKTRLPLRTPGLIAERIKLAGGGIDVTDWSPEMWEHYLRAKDMLDEISEGYVERLRLEDPEFEMPIENWIKHMFRTTETPLDKVRRNMRVRQYRQDRMAQLRLDTPGMSKSQAERMVEQEVWEKFGVREVRMTKAERESGISSFMARKYSSVEDRIEHATILTMQRGQFPIDWEDDFYKLLNSSYAEFAKWKMGVTLTDELIRRRLAVAIPPGTKAEDARRLLGSQKIVPLEADNLMKLLPPDKNPYRNLWVDRNVKALYDRYLTGQVQMAVGNETVQRVLDYANAFRRGMSAWYLLPFLAYHNRNLVGDTLRAMHEGLDINLLNPAVLKRWLVSWKMATPIELADLKRALPPPLRNTLQDYGLQNKLDELRQLYPQHAELLTPEKFDQFLQANVLEVNYRDFDQLQEMGDALKEAGLLRKAMSILNPNPVNNIMMQTMGKLGNRVQNQTRMFLFLDRLDHFTQNGILDLPDAMKESARLVRKSLFDYSDLLPIEQNIYKNVNWFYTYMSRSIPYHIEKMITDPNTFSKYYRAYMGFWNNHMDEFEPEDTRPFLSEQLGVPVYKYADDETGEEKWAVWIPQGWLGVGDVNEAASWLRAMYKLDQPKLLQALAMNTNPMVKGTLEQAFAVDMWTGEELDANEYSDVFGIPMPYRVNRLIRNFRLFNEIDRLNPGGVWTKINKGVFHAIEDERAHRFETREAERWWQFATGMRLFEAAPLRDTRRNLFDLAGKVRDFQQTARRAAKQGNLWELNKNKQNLLEIVPEVKEAQERLRFWQEQQWLEKQRQAIRDAD